MIFVDTGGWFALTVPTDPNHARATAWLETNNDTLFTSDYIVDETLTLLRARGEHRRALVLGESLFGNKLAVVYRLSANDLERGWAAFRDFHDKDWSFTDCTSKAIMELMDIRTAFAFDRHFRQFGSITVVPE
jgi:predicted nucleic acid-binding protein